MEFEVTNKDLGEVKVGDVQKVLFPYDGVNVIGIDKAEASCDCTDFYVDKDNNTFVAVWKPSDIPIHLKAQGYVDTQKSITVWYRTKDNPKEIKIIILLFNARVINK